jgi:hypothetical protein
MPPADNTPDFDKMTPEEIMAWMESLAKRQGADAAQFTTSADMEIAEIDPSTVVIDEPGYVPSEGKMKGKKIETIMPSKPAAPKAPAEPARPAAAAAPPPPVAAAPKAAPAVAATPPSPVPPKAAPPPPAAKQPEPEGASALSWLESLAADQGGDFPALDLSSIAADIASTSAPQPAASINPVDWLENLAQSQGVENAAPVEAAPESGDPVSWLESLAKRQGAPTEELTTAANLDVPIPKNVVPDGPGYTDYTFETPDTALKQGELNIPAASKTPAKAWEPSELQDPAAWLDALAASQGAGEAKPTERQMTDDEIQKALAKGQPVPHDQMEAWMNRQLEIGAQRPEPEELAAYDPDAPAVKAEIPDWLLEQVGQAPPEEAAPLPPSAPPLIDAILEPPAVADIPDWLRDEAPSDSELENIFVPASASAAPAAQKGAIEIDPNDPWVEALEMEYAHGKSSASPPLQEAALQPETELPAGEPEPVPDWLESVTAEPAAVPGDMPDWLLAEVGGAPPAPVEQPAVAGDMPDWLKTVDIEASEVPSWLTETLGTSEDVASVPAPQPVPVASAPVTTPPVRPASPAPVPTRVLQIDVPATLQAARSQANSNDIDACLKSYEMLIRANAELGAVVNDLTKLSEKVKTQPAVYRVLGDGLMRQGQLQAALDIYRKALNQL